jgi:DNA gyrase subunit B
MVQQNRNGWRWIARKLSDCSEQDQQNASMSREIRQAEQQNKVVTVRFKQFCLRGKILNVEKAMHHKVFEEIRNIFTALGLQLVLQKIVKL